jgi:flagellar motor switch protein FliM
MGNATMGEGRACSPILERLVGDSGEASQVIGAGRSMAERALPLLQKSLAETGSAVTLELRTVEVGRVPEARAQAGESFAMAIVASAFSSDAMTMVLDAPAIAIMVSALFGGDDDMAIVPIERELSYVEVDVAMLVFQQAAEVFNGSGRRSLELKLPIAPALSGTEARRRVLRDGAAVRIVIGLSTPTETGTLTILIPQRVLLTRRNGADAAEDGEAPGHWRARFSEEVMRSSVRLDATMPLGRLTLGQIAGLQKGQVLELDKGAPVQARLWARSKALFACEFGKLGENHTVRISGTQDEGQDFIDSLARQAGI